MKKESYIKRFSQVFLTIGILIIVISIINIFFLEDFLLKKNNDHNKFSGGLFLLGLSIYLVSEIFRDLYSGKISLGWYWLGDDIEKSKNPKSFWIIFIVTIIGILFLWYFSSLFFIRSF